MADYIDPRNPEGLRLALKTARWVPDKQHGQHFLVVPQWFERLAEVVAESESLHVLEIGPGPGGLTIALLERGLRVLAVELDRRAQTLLTAIQAAYPDQLAVAFLDVLQLTAEAIASRLGPGPVAVAGNLPYYLTAPIMGKLVAVDWPWQHAVLMVQREVATRLSANPGERASSALGVLLRYRADIRVIVEKIAPDAFYPPPEIVSSVIQLKRRDALPVPWDAFQWVVHAGFQHRRKMLRQALARGVRSPWDAQTWDRVLEGIAIDPSRRAESLTIPEWVRLASAVGAAPK